MVKVTRAQQMGTEADKLIVGVLWLLMGFSLALAGWHDTWLPALLVGLPAVALPTMLYLKAPGEIFTRCASSAALMVFAALNIHQADGMNELHFGIFVYLAFLLAYRDWRPIVVAAVVIAVHHLSFQYLQQWGYGVRCFTRPSLWITVIHAAYVVVEAAVLIFLARIMRRAAAQAAELEAMVTALAATTGRIDLTPLPVTPRSRLGNSLRDMIAAIRETLGGVRAGTDTIAGASGEIAHGSAELSQRTVRQAASIEQTVAAMVQLAATVRRNNDNARAANALAQSASDIAGRGGAAVREVVATMGGISASSRQIADIIGVIDGIAFQTNILALNAAVEAARAGEQGRGFAVVASEVRNLAQRSAAAAREIKALISDSVTRVETGSGLVNDAGAIIVQVVDSVQRVTAIMGEMSHAAVEQNEGIERINHALVAIDEATQQNAALARQDLEAAQALTGEVQHLTTLVAAFKLGDGGARPAPVQLR